MYNLVVVELKDVVPRRDPDKPNLYVGYVNTQAESLAQIVSSAPDWVQGNEIELRPDLTRPTTFATQKRAKKARKKLFKKLMGQNYTVNKKKKIWRLYVIELDPKGIGDVGLGYVYVGETSKTREGRFQQHKTGAKNKSGTCSLGSRKTRGRVVSLRHDLIPKQVYFSSKDSKAAEARLAERLREKGCRVVGGH